MSSHTKHSTVYVYFKVYNLRVKGMRHKNTRVSNPVEMRSSERVGRGWPGLLTVGLISSLAFSL